LDDFLNGDGLNDILFWLEIYISSELKPLEMNAALDLFTIGNGQREHF